MAAVKQLTSNQALAKLARQPYLFALVLLISALIVNYILQPSFFNPIILSGNLRTFMPLMLLAAGQTIIILGGGIDLSIGSIVTLVNVVVVSALGADPTGLNIALAFGLGLGASVLAGALNGFCVAFLRFQPIVTTFATNSVFAGLALYVLPSPQGGVPPSLTSLLRMDPIGIPLTIWVGVVVLLLWRWLSLTRYGSYLYASGGDALSAYYNGIPVGWVKFSSYILGAIMAAISAFALVLSTGTGDPHIAGEEMMLSSIVAAVIGGTSLRGGYGGIAGPLMGAVFLGLVRTIIFFANVPNWYQTLVDGLIVMLALAGPGLIWQARRLTRRHE